MKIKFVTRLKSVSLLALALGFTSCGKDNFEPAPEQDYGVYVLNEGGFLKNNSSLSYYNYDNHTVILDYYGGVNSNARLGDAAQDIQLFDSRIFITVNGSNKVQVLDAKTFKNIAEVNIPSPRYLVFSGGKIFVTSFDDNVYVLDATSYQKIKTIGVGRDPEQMAIVGNKLYVANSGGLDFPTYDNTVSVIDLSTLTEVKKITVSPNPFQVFADKYGDIYVGTKGDYNTIASNLYVIKTATDAVQALNVPISGMAVNGDIAYIYSADYNYGTDSWMTNYRTLNLKDETLGAGFITDGTENSIEVPYGIAVEPVSGDIYLSDGKDFQAEGTVYRFDKNGKKKFSFAAGVLPSKFFFLSK